MTLKEYQKSAYTAIQYHEDEKDEVLNWAIGLAEETGEVLGLLKHKYWAGEDVSLTELAKETGDVLWYLAALCTIFGLDLETVAELNVGKINHRHRAGEFSVERSHLRHELETKYESTEEYKKPVERLKISQEV